MAEKSNITIVTFLLSKNTYIYNEMPFAFQEKREQNLFEISSKTNYKNPLAHYYIKKGYNFPSNGQGKLHFYMNIKQLTNKSSLADDLNQIRYEGINIKIEDMNYNNLKYFSYRFTSKNQIFGTCWANAYSAAIFLTNKRIFGRKSKTFETYRENLIKFACDKNGDDGGNINEDKVVNYFERNKIYFDKLDEEEAKNALMKGRVVVCDFRLNDQQWDNFDKFYQTNKRGILEEEDINVGCDQSIDSNLQGHSVLLIEIEIDKEGKSYLRFLNSWGQNWADEGTFKVRNGNALKGLGRESCPPIFYDIYFLEEDLTDEEIKYFNKNIRYIRETLSKFGENNISFDKIKNRLNDLYGLNGPLITCQKCKKVFKLNNLKIVIMENGLYHIYCLFCHYKNIANGDSKEYLVLKNLIDDGNDDFDINFEAKYYIDISRVKLHGDCFKAIMKNDSDLCSIGSENFEERKIDSPFKSEVNCIISLKNNKFVVSSLNKILIFKLEDKNIKYLLEKDISNEKNIRTLCNLKLNNLDIIATGGNNIKIFHYNTNDLKLLINLENDKGINKIIFIEERNIENIGKLAFCDQIGYIGLYNIKKNNKPNINDLFSKRKCHDSYINCILYIKGENILVSSGDKNIKFWIINEQKKDLILIEEFKILSSELFNNNLLDINGNLIVGEKNGIRVFHHENQKIIDSYFYKNEEFGDVFTIASLGRNYFICGREYGFCSIFLLRVEEGSVRKINIFRNNNLNDYNNSEIPKDDYYITDICVKEDNSDNFGYILISSFDKTLKVYKYVYSKVSGN